MIAVILASGRLDRLYTALSLLVSVAAEGEQARGLVTFGALGPMLDAELEARALLPAETRLEGVLSTPRFLRETGAARLVVV